ACSRGRGPGDGFPVPHARLHAPRPTLPARGLTLGDHPRRMARFRPQRIPMSEVLSEAALDQLFRTARTYRRSAEAWLDRPVSDAQLQAIYDLAKLAPTSANASPGRFVFVRSPEAKAKLEPALDRGNVAQTMAAPVTVIVAADHAFYEHLPRLYKESP